MPSPTDDRTGIAEGCVTRWTFIAGANAPAGVESERWPAGTEAGPKADPAGPEASRTTTTNPASATPIPVDNVLTRISSTRAHHGLLLHDPAAPRGRSFGP